jgi:dTDP-4-dehydrorhamnose reductase
MRLLLTGAAGQLGCAVHEAGRDRCDLVGVDLPDGDLTRPQDVDAILDRVQPDWVLHAAAFTDVDAAETHREQSLAVNGTATALLAAACARRGAGLTFVSTDYVFAGTDPRGYDEEAPRDPVNHYGLTKARGEEAVEAMTGRWQIVRTSWLFGPGLKNFVLTVRRLLAERPELRVVEDQVGCPTYAPDLAEILLFLVENGSPGFYHATNRGSCSWFAFAREIARQSGADPQRVRPCSTAEFPTPARRPACSILRSHRLEAAGYGPRPTWQDALARYLQRLGSGREGD